MVWRNLITSALAVFLVTGCSSFSAKTCKPTLNVSVTESDLENFIEHHENNEMIFDRDFTNDVLMITTITPGFKCPFY